MGRSLSARVTEVVAVAFCLAVLPGCDKGSDGVARAPKETPALKPETAGVQLKAAEKPAVTLKPTSPGVDLRQPRALPAVPKPSSPPALREPPKLPSLLSPPSPRTPGTPANPPTPPKAPGA